MSGRIGRGWGRGSTSTNGRNPAETIIEEAPIQAQVNSDLPILYKNFTNLGGKTFKGTESVVEAQAWIRSCERIFRGLRLDDGQKRMIAS